MTFWTPYCSEVQPLDQTHCLEDINNKPKLVTKPSTTTESPRLGNIFFTGKGTFSVRIIIRSMIWAATWQNQQMSVRPAKTQIRIFAVPWRESLIILVIYFTYPVNPFIARSGISQLREFPWDRAQFSDYARLQNWKWIIPPNLPNRLFYSKQSILKLIFSKRLRLNIFESIRTG